MPQDAEKLNILNRALLMMGEPRVADLESNQASFEDADFQYDHSRRAILRQHSWNFATNRVEIDADGDEPAFEFSKRYPLPEDFIRLHEVHRMIPDFRYQIENGFILSNVGSPMPVVYIYDNENPLMYDELFKETLALHIASTLSYKVVQSRALREELGTLYQISLRKAKFVESTEQSMQRIQAFEWLDSRFGRIHPSRFDNVVPPTS